MMVSVVLLCAGSSQRFGRDKLSLPLGGRPVWRWAYDAFTHHPEVHEVIVVTSETRLSEFDGARVVVGGADRQGSAQKGIEACAGDVVLVHDGARPFVTRDLISRVIAGAKAGGCGPAIPLTDTIRNVHLELVDRETLRAMQTPQGAPKIAWLAALNHQFSGMTDDLSLLQAAQIPIELIEGDPANIKITTESDYATARGRLGAPESRTGFGYDVHAFSDDSERPMWLGGVEFDHRPGLMGHSDADVLLHAIADALLGSLALGDIGVLFPNTDPAFKDKRSKAFVEEAMRRVRDRGYECVHVDATVIAEVPKVMVKQGEIRAAIANMIDISPDRVSVKATTHERLGSLGRAEGIAAMAVVTVVQVQE